MNSVMAGLPAMKAPVLFCDRCDEAICVIHWVADENDEPNYQAVNKVNFCPFCGTVMARNGEAGEGRSS